MVEEPISPRQLPHPTGTSRQPPRDTYKSRSDRVFVEWRERSVLAQDRDEADACQVDGIDAERGQRGGVGEGREGCLPGTAVRGCGGASGRRRRLREEEEEEEEQDLDCLLMLAAPTQALLPNRGAQLGFDCSAKS